MRNDVQIERAALRQMDLFQVQSAEGEVRPGERGKFALFLLSCRRSASLFPKTRDRYNKELAVAQDKLKKLENECKCVSHNFTGVHRLMLKDLLAFYWTQ